MVDGLWPEPRPTIAMFNYEKLEVWQEAIAFADLIYSITKRFPSEERFGLTNQMRRAVVSISSNLAEGSARNSRIEFARFVEVASGSTFEVASQAFIAHRQDMLSEADFNQVYEGSEKLGRMLSGLRRSLLEGRGQPAHQPSTINHQP
jgi:four helix bundle protein